MSGSAPERVGPAHDPLAGARFTIAAPADLRASADTLALADAPLAELRARAGELSRRYIDAVVDGFVLALARAVRGVPGAGARSANLVRGFADRFVAPGVRGARHEQIDDFVDFLRRHAIERDGHPVVAFDVDPTFAAALAPALAAAGRANRDLLRPAFHAMIDACMRHLLDEPLAMLHLGLVARAAIAVGLTGVTSRAHRLVDEVLRGADDAPVLRLAAFVADSIVLGA